MGLPTIFTITLEDPMYNTRTLFWPQDDIQMTKTSGFSHSGLKR